MFSKELMKLRLKNYFILLFYYTYFGGILAKLMRIFSLIQKANKLQKNDRVSCIT